MISIPKLWRWLLCTSVSVTMFVCQSAVAIEMQRPILNLMPGDHGQLFVQGDYVSTGFDFLNYGAKAPGSAKLDYYATGQAGFRYALTDEIKLGYRAYFNRQRAVRATEPVEVNTRILGQDIRLQYVFYRNPHTSLGFELGYISDKARDENIYTYDFNGVRVTRLGGLPLVTVKARDHGWLGAVRGLYHWNENITLHVGIEARRYDVAVRMQSDSALVTSLLSSQAPQSTPWQVNHFWAQLGLDWHVQQSIDLAIDYAHLQVKRANYIAKTNKPDVNDADWLDVYIGWQLGHGFSFVGHGRLMSHFILGDMPLLYNTRSNHKFRSAFGLVSAAFVWTF